jgi:hypothetical protein
MHPLVPIMKDFALNHKLIYYDETEEYSALFDSQPFIRLQILGKERLMYAVVGRFQIFYDDIDDDKVCWVDTNSLFCVRFTGVYENAVDLFLRKIIQQCGQYNIEV